MYIVCKSLKNERTKYHIKLLKSMFSDIQYTIVDKSSYYTIIQDDKPVIYLGQKLFEELTGYITIHRGNSVWINGQRHLYTYSLDEVHNNPNLFVQFYRDIYIPTKFPITKEPTDDIIIHKGCPSNLPPGLYSFDLETHFFNPLKGYIINIAVATDFNTAYIIEPDDPNLDELFTNPNYQWVAQNGKYDIKWLVTHRNLRPNLVHDIMLLHYILDERKGTHGLKDLCQSRLALPDYEAELNKHKKNKKVSYTTIPRQVLDTYAAKDAVYTLRLFYHLQQELEAHHHSQHLKKAYKFVMAAQDMYTDVELNGIHVDLDFLNKKEIELAKVLEESTKKVIEASGIVNFNPNSSQQVGKYVYDIKGYKNPGLSKVARIRPRTTDAETMRGLLELYPDDVLLINLSAVKQTKKLLSTYLRPIKEKMDFDGRIRPDFNVHGTETGRPSCKNPNLQNLPRKKSGLYSDGIRQMFNAETGNVLVQLDFKAAELRVACILSEDTSLKGLFESGIDLHTATAIEMFKIEKPTDEERTTAKTMNFKLLFGGQSYSVARGMKISQEYAQKLMDLWWKPKVKLIKWFKDIEKECSKTLEIVMRSGRIRRLPFDTTDNHVKNIIKNTEIQSLASDSCVQAAIWINKWLKRRNLGKVVLTVHDNIVVECRKEDSEKVANTCMYIMKRAGRKVLQTDFVHLLADHYTGEYLK